MANLTRQQEKAMFAKQNQGQVRSETEPSFIGRLKAKEQAFIEKRRIRREQKGLDRIEKEKQALEKEKITAKRLRAELEVEQARENVAQQKAETQVRFREIEKERRKRRLAPFIGAGKRVVATGKQVIATGKALEKATRPKRARKRKARAEPEQDFFQI